MPPLLIAKTGETLQDCALRCGDFEHWFVRGMGIDPADTRVVCVHQGEPLPTHGEVSGIVVTGSHAMVTDRAPWSEALAEWLAEAVPRGLPVLGVCYGHQLLAHALGGEVDYHPAGPEVGTVPVRLTPAAQTDPLLGRLPEAFYVHATHAQSVVRLPPGAVHLAGNAFEPHHAFRVGERAWGVQFHPEFDIHIMRTYVQVRAARCENPDRDWAAIRATVRDTPESAALLRQFANLVKTGEIDD
jgi:GMP synthase (glutamine-hydrolysing)